MTAKTRNKRQFLKGTIGGVRVIAANYVTDAAESVKWDNKPTTVVDSNNGPLEDDRYDESYTGPRNSSEQSNALNPVQSGRPMDSKDDEKLAALIKQVSFCMGKLTNALSRGVGDGSIRRKHATQPINNIRRAAVMDGGLSSYLKDNADEKTAQITAGGDLVANEEESANVIDENGKITEGFKPIRFEGDERPEGAIAAAFRRANDNNVPDTQARETERAANIIDDLDDVGIKQGELHEQRAMDAAYKLDHELIPVSGGKIFRKDLRAFGESVMNKQYSRIRSFYRDDNGNRVYLK
ncbi:hypothetical protein JX85_23630 [Salmonella enterica]|nr:hypothetical protein [Salmonella enterica]